MTPTREQGSTGGWLLSVSVVFSTAAHIAIAGYFLLTIPSKDGAVDTPTMAISVNLKTTEILNAVDSPDAAEAAAPSDASPETAPPEEAGEQADPPVEDHAEEREEERRRLAEEAERNARAEAERQRQEAEQRAQEKERQLAEQRKREEERARAEQRERERQRAEEQAREKKAAKARETERKRRADAQRKADAELRRKQAQASSAARGSTGSKASKGRVSASRGDLRDYGAQVRARIARSESDNRGRGEAVLSLALSPSGRLVSVRIIRSSGDPSLDRSILAAVRRASPFPKPPDGATARQLHFTLPIAVR
jgi:colicin import membrane protein